MKSSQEAPTEEHEFDPNLSRRLREAILEIPPQPTGQEKPPIAFDSRVAPDENAAYILPDIFGQSEDSIVIAINPINGGFKPSERFAKSLKDDLKVDVQETIMPMTFIGEEGRLLEPLGDQTDNELIDQMIAGEKPGKIGGWFGYQLSGEGYRIHDPNLPEYIGALVAREFSEGKKDTETLWLEDVSHQKAEPGHLKLAGDNYNLAEEITEEHKVPDLDQAIIEDRNRLFNKGRRAARAILERLGDSLPGSHDRIVYH